MKRIKYALSYGMEMMEINIDHNAKRLKSKLIQISRFHKPLDVDLKQIDLDEKIFNYNS